jgi:hypothetical protein
LGHIHRIRFGGEIGREGDNSRILGNFAWEEVLIG